MVTAHLKQSRKNYKIEKNKKITEIIGYFNLLY